MATRVDAYLDDTTKRHPRSTAQAWPDGQWLEGPGPRRESRWWWVAGGLLFAFLMVACALVPA